MSYTALSKAKVVGMFDQGDFLKKKYPKLNDTVIFYHQVQLTLLKG